MTMDDPGNRLWAAGASLALAAVLALGCSGGSGRTDGGTDAAWDAGTDGDAGPDGDPEPITPIDELATPERGFMLGMLPIPARGQDFAQAHRDAAQAAELVPIWGPPAEFYELADALAGDWGRLFLTEYVRGNRMLPLIHLSFMLSDEELSKPPDLPNASLADPEWRRRYTQAAVEVVRTARPALLSLGNEVNRWYAAHGDQADDPNGFGHFVSLYEDTYDRVKALSPDTLVFCTFSREIVAERRTADLAAALALFDPDKLDVVVLTSYPWAVAGINLPSQVPDDYFLAPLRAAGMEAKPFGLSEFAWPALPEFGGQAAQAAMVWAGSGRLTRSQGLDLFFFMWPWMHDLDAEDETGLRRRDGTAKLVWQDWRRLATGEPAPHRGEAIPADAVKRTPDDDLFPPLLHAADEFEPCHPLPGPVNTAGVEDSPYMAPDGSAFYFTFLPDAQAPPEQQLTDGVTGIWRSRIGDDGWSVPQRVRLSGEPTLDGCPTVVGERLWFCSVRADNLGEVDLFTAEWLDGLWTNWSNCGTHINQHHDFGEMHLAADGRTMWFQLEAAAGGQGGRDLWRASRQADGWSAPVNLGPVVNDAGDQAQPFVSRDGSELWFTSPSKQGLTGPAVWRSVRVGQDWSSPEEMVGNFAGEPNLDAAGNLYFVHHFFSAELHKVEGDIYVCPRR